MDKQRSKKRSSNTNLLKTRVIISCSSSGTRRVNLATHPVISHERGKDRNVLRKVEDIRGHVLLNIFHNGQPSHGGDR